jgi:hypothetical protein
MRNADTLTVRIDIQMLFAAKFYTAEDVVL